MARVGSCPGWDNKMGFVGTRGFLKIFAKVTGAREFSYIFSTSNTLIVLLEDTRSSMEVQTGSREFEKVQEG